MEGSRNKIKKKKNCELDCQRQQKKIETGEDETKKVQEPNEGQTKDELWWVANHPTDDQPTLKKCHSL